MKDKNIELSGIPRFCPSGSVASSSDSPRKRLSKPVLILFALAIIFAILGFIDLKVNAAESETYVSSWWSKIYVDSNGEEQVAKNDWYTYTSSSPLEVFYYQSHDDYVTGEPVAFAIYVVSDSPITASGSTSSFKSTEYVFDDRTINVCMSSSGTSFTSPLSGYVEVTTDADNVKRLNSMYSMDEFVDYYESEVNAAESTQSIEFLTTWYNTLEGELVESQKYKYIVSCDSDAEVFYIQSHISATNTENTFSQVYFVSKSPILCDKYTYSNGQYYYDNTYAGIQYTLNGQTFYVRQVADLCTNTGNGSWNGYVDLEFNYNGAKELSRWYDPDEFFQAYANEYLDIVIDYDSLKIDNDMPVVENLKRNYVEDKNDTGVVGVKIIPDIYDLLSWTNTSEEYVLQLETIPIVQYRKIGMDVNSWGVVADNTLIKEFQDSWRTEAIFEDVTNTYTKLVDGEMFLLEDSDAWSFYCECNDTYSVGAFEDGFLVFGYRLRYVDRENQKAGPWVCLMPSEKQHSYISYIEYSDDSTNDLGNADGVYNEYDNLENIEDAITDVETENKFQDKYEVIEDERDVQSLISWLNNIVSFIKGTPSLVGSVLSFLPTPILNGIYATIYLAIFACAIAIIKALI